MRRLLFAAAVAVLALAGLTLPGIARAHPLGNFTINHYSRVQPSGDRIYVLYVLDMAEIPTFRVRQTMRSPEAYATATARTVAHELELRVGGRRLELAPIRHAIAFPPGVGGLDTLRLEVVFRTARLSRAAGLESLSYRDVTFRARIGWKEVVVAAAGDARITASSVPARSISGELLAYPKNLLQSPSDVTSATASFEPGTEAGPVPQLPSMSALAQRVTVRTPPDGAFASLVARRDLGPGFLVLSLAIALFWGAAHAFSPGHGKAIVAGYLVGTRGRMRDAVALGLIVTFTHTIGVFALGGVTLLLSQLIVPEELYPWLNLVSALLVVAVGIGILRWRMAVWRRGSVHDHDHRHPHSHAHGSDHHHRGDDGHDHGSGKRSGLLGIGVSAGIIPCPTALVVLLAAISLHRVGYGLVLILAFSVGLAIAVTSIGLVAVLARSMFGRVSLDGTVVRALPAVSALVVLALGVAMTARALPRVL
ncbi:MAG TPA: sulfite exporter TauE/SafE family protein [Gaiellaceae bacterium]|nr:sulfite exporter TauE/SafE family protein [Gaiellaceae bacterium]